MEWIESKEMHCFTFHCIQNGRKAATWGGRPSTRKGPADTSPNLSKPYKRGLNMDITPVLALMAMATWAKYILSK